MHPLKGRKQSLEHIQKRIAAREYRPLTKETKEKIRRARAFQVFTRETRLKMSITQKRIGNKPPLLYGEDNPGWKGDQVKYRSLHSWVERRLGKPQLCSNCQTNKSKRFNWANISHEYKRDLDDWIRLCGSCHIKYDRYGMKLKLTTQLFPS